LDLWAREHYKSTIITFALTIQDILASHGEDPIVDEEVTVGLFSHTRPIAKQFLRQIKTEFERNETLKTWFPDILWANPQKEKGTKWSEDEGIVVKRQTNPKESTIEAWGLVDGQPTSKHFKLAVYDDVVTRESVTTPDMIKKTTAAWELSRNLTAIGGASRYIGTRYHYFDTYATMMERGIRARIHRATVDGTEFGVPVFLPSEVLAQKRIEMQETFSAQMLMEPKSKKDAYFKPEWFLERYVTPEQAASGMNSEGKYRILPSNLHKYGASDYATKQGRGDYTVHGVVGNDIQDDIYVLDLWREQAESNVWVEEFITLALKHKPMKWAEPKDQINNSLGPFIDRRMRERKCYVLREQFSEAGDKTQKARAIQARAAMGKVILPAYAPWLDELVAELMAFPIGANDDQVDFLSLIGRMLDAMLAPADGKKKDDRKKDGWAKAFADREGSGSNWKTG